MSIRQISSGGGGRKHLEAALQVSPLELNLTAERSALKEGQASVIIGRNVIKPGRLAKAPRRRRISATVDANMIQELDIAFGGHPFTTAIPCNMRGNVVKRQSYNSGAAITPGTAYEYFDVTPTNTFLRMTAAGIAKYTDWPDGAKAAVLAGKPASIVFDDHLPPVGGVSPKGVRNLTPQAFRPNVEFGSLDVPSAGVGGVLDEAWATPNYDVNTAGNFFAGKASTGFNFTLQWTEYFDKRGIWVSNGQKFWLLQNGRYTKYLDLGATSGTLGIEWRGAQISPNVFMFVHPNFPPRIISLESEPQSAALNEVDATKYLGGLLTPDLGQRDYPPSQFVANTPGSGTLSLNASLSSGGSAKRVSPGPPGGLSTYRVRVRVIDERTGTVSRFVDASYGAIGYATLASADQSLQLNQTQTTMVLIVYPHVAAFGPTIGEGFILDNFAGKAQFRIPFKTARGTHIEFWRTTGGGISFFKELRKALAFPSTAFFNSVYAQIPNQKFLDATFSTKVTDIAPYTDPLQKNGEHAAMNLPDFDLQRQQLMTFVDERAGGLPPMCRDIISVLGCTLAGGANKLESALLLQGKRLIWPRITHDGAIRYSEISGGFAFLYPESFHSLDFVTLTRGEDRFQRFVMSSDVVLAVYTKGVYRLAREATAINKKQLGESGIGTPWANAILPIGKLALWVTPQAIRVFNAEAENGIGDLQTIEHGPMLNWFQDALINGMQVDAGYDERYGTLHLRRNKVVDLTGGVASPTSPESDSLLSGVSGLTGEEDPPTETALSIEDAGGVAAPTITQAKIAYYLDSAAVFNLKTGDWTLIDDDNGFRYVAAEGVEDLTTIGPKLYTIDQLGGVFEENYAGKAHPYDHLVQQETLTAARWVFNDRQIITQSGNRFTELMEGDVVRFRSDNPLKDGLARTIRNADPGRIEFDPLPAALVEGDEFVIGAVRFKVRFSPIMGESMRDIKTIDQAEIYARPGPLHDPDGSPGYPPRPDFGLTVRVYRDYGNTARAESTAEIEIFDDDDADTTSMDRYCTLKAQGRALEVEIEDFNTRSDVVIDGVYLRVEDEGDFVADASGSA